MQMPISSGAGRQAGTVQMKPGKVLLLKTGWGAGRMIARHILPQGAEAAQTYKDSRGAERKEAHVGQRGCDDCAQRPQADSHQQHCGATNPAAEWACTSVLWQSAVHSFCHR